MTRLRLTADLVETMADEYVDTQNGSEGSVERRLFAVDGLHGDLQERGYATLEQLVEIVRWKSGPRTLRHFSGPDARKDCETITRLAFSDPAEGVRHRLLSLIKGVNRPTASAVLAVWRPDSYTVIDFRAVRTLIRSGELDRQLSGAGQTDPWAAMKQLSYGQYLEVCRGILNRLNSATARTLTLRDLDRALWQLDKST